MFSHRPEISGTFGVVTSTHWLATAAGMSILEKGGNAFDAAVATGLSLHIVEPDQNGPGGETPLIICKAETNEVKVICGQGPAPMAATVSAYRDLGLDAIPGSGPLSAVVPGSFGAWMLLLLEYGTMSLRTVLSPAIEYALKGYTITPHVSEAISAGKSLFMREWPSSAEVFLPGGNVPPPGTLFKATAIAGTYRRVLAEAESVGNNRDAQIEKARQTWYEGFVAEAIDHHFLHSEAMDTSGQRHRGFLTGEDLARWRATIEEPLKYDYHNYTLCKTGPWGQGPVALQQLALLKALDLGASSPTSIEFVHPIIECTKLALADREAFYGDPAFVDVPIQSLLSDEYNMSRRKLIGNGASYEVQPGQVSGYETNIKIKPKGSTKNILEAMAATSVSEPTPLHRIGSNIPEPGDSDGDTTHFDIIDSRGNMVSGTPSGGRLGGSPVIPGLGFPLTTRCQMFWLDESAPNGLAPGKRPRTTLSPSIALKNQEPYMAFGTPGGDKQDQWAIHAFLRHVHCNLDLQDAIDAPEFHTNHAPSSFFPRECEPGHLALEKRFGEDMINAATKRGHTVSVYDDYTLGYVTAATRDQGLLKAGASSRRRQCYAAGR